MEDSVEGGPAVLFIRFSSLGDVVLATAAVRSLKTARPGARITFLTKDLYRPLLEGNPAIDRVVGFRDSGGRGGLVSLYRLCRSLGPFDAVIDLHGSLRSRLAAASVRAARRLRYRKSSLERRLWVMGWMRGTLAHGGRHVVDRYLDTLEAMGVSPGCGRPEVFISDGEMKEASVLLSGAGVRDPGRVAVIAPGARWPNKRWPSGKFARLGEWLVSEKGLELAIAGDREDRPVVDELRKQLAVASADISGRTGLRELGAVLRRARIFIGNDSGPGHLAAAVGTPVVTVFGPTSEAFGFPPRGDRVRSVSLPLECRPCSLHGGRRCSRGRRACLEDLEPGAVIGAAEEVLDTP
jgi:heptosyltransferase-2